MRYPRIVAVVLVLAVALVFTLSACAPSAPAPTPPTPPAAPDKIKIGAVLPLSCWAAADAERPQLFNYKMWIDDLNAQGGIFVKDYNKRIPVELILYDDKCDPGTATKMYEKLIVGDKVHLLLAPWGTAWHFAVAPLVNSYKYPLLGITEASNELRAQAKYSLPYFFGLENQPLEINTGVVEVLSEAGAKTAAVIFVGTLYGIDHTSIVLPLLETSGINVLLYKSYPLEATDFSPLLKEIKALNPDALLAYSYPADGMLIQEQAMVIDLNPKAFYNSFAGFPDYKEKFGAKAVEGMLGSSAWNKDLPIPGAKEYFDKYVARWNKEPTFECAYGYATLQIWEKVLAEVGLDRTKQRDYIATQTFPTVWGNIKFVDQYNVDTPDNPNSNPGTLGQMQNGVYQPVAPKAKSEALGIKVIYPKPAWPK
jgi:branched-chain amino acid transport system substrate-binding protein